MKIVFTVFGLLVLALAVAAQPQQSENFRITKSVLDAGGQRSTSQNFVLTSAFGQPGTVGLSSSANFQLSSGFLSPAFAVSPLSPIADLVVKRDGLTSNMQLNWSAVPSAASYSIYRDAVPTFTPGPANLVGTTPSNAFTDIGAVTLPLGKYFYIVTSTAGNTPPVARSGGADASKSVLAGAPQNSR